MLKAAKVMYSTRLFIKSHSFRTAAQITAMTVAMRRLDVVAALNGV
jgi:hypothetical protein